MATPLQPQAREARSQQRRRFRLGMSNPTTPRVPRYSLLVLGSPRRGRTAHCTAHPTTPAPGSLGASQRAGWGAGGERNTVLGEDWGLSNIALLRPKSLPGLWRKRRRPVCPSFARVLGVGLALRRIGDSFARKIHRLGRWIVLQSRAEGYCEGGRARSHSPRGPWSEAIGIHSRFCGDTARPTTSLGSTLLAASPSTLSSRLPVS